MSSGNLRQDFHLKIYILKFSLRLRRCWQFPDIFVVKIAKSHNS